MIAIKLDTIVPYFMDLFYHIHPFIQIIDVMVDFVLVQINFLVLLMLTNQIEIVIDLYQLQQHVPRLLVDRPEIYHFFLFQFILSIQTKVLIEHDITASNIHSFTIWVPYHHCL